MTVTVDGQDFSGQKMEIIDGRMHMIIPMGVVPNPIINGIEHSKYAYHVVDGVATLLVPMGEGLVDTYEQPTLDLDLGPSDELVSRLGNMLGTIEDVVPERCSAPIIDIAIAREGTRHRTPKARERAHARTNFTRRPIG